MHGQRGSIGVLFGDGKGSFGNWAQFQVHDSPSAMISNDFNDDKKSDLAVANYASNDVSILFGNGKGSFKK